MKKNNSFHINVKGSLKYVFLAAVIFFSWLPVLNIPFINDDYQILGYNSSNSFLSIIKPFWSSDISQFYWRPLGNIIHPLILIIAGFNPFAFRIASILLYAFCCLVILYTLRKLNLKTEVAVFFSVLFALLPSHEFQVAWIAEQGESLLAALLVLSFISYYSAIEKDKISGKYLTLSLIFFAASLLVKELAFVGIFIPIIAYIAKKGKTEVGLKTIIKHICIASGILFFVLLYRLIIIGGTPFGSPNFAGSGPIIWAKNFFIYIPLAFLPPEVLEFLFYNLKNLVIIIPLCLTIVIFIYLFFHAFTRLDKEKKNLVYAGFAWYVVFVLPALLILMRWYVFTASIGLIISLACIFEYYWQKQKGKIAGSVFLSLVFAVLMFFNFSTMQKWVETGNKFESALKSIKSIKNEIKSDSIIVWCVPDKLDRIPMMKLGVDQSVQWVLNDKALNVFAPLRAELTGDTSRIRMDLKSDSVFIFHLYGGRFLAYGGKSKSIIENETITYSDSIVSFRIKTFIKSGEPQSIAVVKLEDKNKGQGQLYYNGSKFVYF